MTKNRADVVSQTPAVGTALRYSQTPAPAPRLRCLWPLPLPGLQRWGARRLALTVNKLWQLSYQRRMHLWLQDRAAQVTSEFFPLEALQHVALQTNTGRTWLKPLLFSGSLMDIREPVTGTTPAVLWPYLTALDHGMLSPGALFGAGWQPPVAQCLLQPAACSQLEHAVDSSCHVQSVAGPGSAALQGGTLPRWGSACAHKAQRDYLLQANT